MILAGEKLMYLKLKFSSFLKFFEVLNFDFIFIFHYSKRGNLSTLKTRVIKELEMHTSRNIYLFQFDFLVFGFS